MTPLDKLIQAVQAGDVSRVDVERMSAEAGLPDAGSEFGRAYAGSLDAASGLHEALLSGWRWDRDADGVMYVEMPDGGAGWYGDDPCAARAWLIAILNAISDTMEPRND